MFYTQREQHGIWHQVKCSQEAEAGGSPLFLLFVYIMKDGCDFDHGLSEM